MRFFPQSNLPSVSLPWMRAVESGINETAAAVEAVTSTYGSGNKAQNSTMKLLSNQIINLADRMEEIANSMSYDAANIGPGTFGNGVYINGSGVLGSVNLNGVTATNVVGGNVYAQSLTTEVTSSRVALWGRTADGFIGTASSSETLKTGIVDADIDPEVVLALGVKHYSYLAEVAKRDDPKSPDYVGPDYHVATEVGMLAEDLHKAGLWQFVVYAREPVLVEEPIEDDYTVPPEDGKQPNHRADVRLVRKGDRLKVTEAGEPIPEGIHYTLFSLAVLKAAQYIHQRTKDLETRVAALESKGAPRLEKL